ncbi:MAG TPA: hypothetical protein EYG70_00105 [Sulfurimonas sp.]|nr:hypothetical protein [Sulfurimonas sp.]
MTTSILSASLTLALDKRLSGEADSRGGIFYDNGNLFAVGEDGFFIYDIDGNYLSSLTTVAGNALYTQNGFAYVTNISGG